MNDDITVAVKVLAWLGGLSVLIGFGLVMVTAARPGGGGARALGAGLMMLFGWATIRDPRNDTVAEVQHARIRKGNRSGDPLDSPDPNDFPG